MAAADKIPTLIVFGRFLGSKVDQAAVFLKKDAACGEECDTQYQSDVDSCHRRYGDDPADASDLAQCIQDAHDDYRDCVDTCAN